MEYTGIKFLNFDDKHNVLEFYSLIDCAESGDGSLVRRWHMVGLNYIMLHKSESRVMEQVLNVHHVASVAIVQAQYLIFFFDKSVTEVRAYKACTTRNKNFFLNPFCLHLF